MMIYGIFVPDEEDVLLGWNIHIHYLGISSTVLFKVPFAMYESSKWSAWNGRVILNSANHRLRVPSIPSEVVGGLFRCLEYQNMFWWWVQGALWDCTTIDLSPQMGVL